MKTPTQIASEVIKGCGKQILDLDGQIAEICGIEYNNVIWLCPSCKSKILAYRTALENELEFLSNFQGLFNHLTGYDSGIISDRISELTSALKILEIK